MPYKDPEVNRAYQKAYHQTYRVTHREEHRNRDRAWRTTSSEESKAKRRAWYAIHRESEAARAARYNKTHREICNANHHRRRAREREAPSTATAEQAKAIKAVYRGKCAYCGCRPVKLTIDHVISLAKGGTHTPENLVPACGSCNSKKGDRDAPNIPMIRLLL